jgi:hypothetical protein
MDFCINRGCKDESLFSKNAQSRNSSVDKLISYKVLVKAARLPELALGSKISIFVVISSPI